VGKPIKVRKKRVRRRSNEMKKVMGRRRRKMKGRVGKTIKERKEGVGKRSLDMREIMLLLLLRDGMCG